VSKGLRSRGSIGLLLVWVMKKMVGFEGECNWIEIFGQGSPFKKELRGFWFGLDCERAWR